MMLPDSRMAIWCLSSWRGRRWVWRTLNIWSLPTWVRPTGNLKGSSSFDRGLKRDLTLSAVLENCAAGSNADPIISLALIILQCDAASPTIILAITVFTCVWKVIWGEKIWPPMSMCNDVYPLIDVDTQSLFSDKADKTGPLLKSKKRRKRKKRGIRNCDLGSVLFW